ncbi:MAG: hypothetical protein DWQ19_09365 [Crenarchaeota archaeon]|nr:MAG: hypothetical protein DWQ19_09365 [Thermoproteota archaeon]
MEVLLSKLMRRILRDPKARKQLFKAGSEPLEKRSVIEFEGKKYKLFFLVKNNVFSYISY